MPSYKLAKGSQSQRLSPLLSSGFIIPFLYWIYLLFTSTTQVVWDSLEYEQLGRLLLERGWLEYFRTGPNREPLYPIFVSLSMQWAGWLNAPYLKVLAVLQFFCLFLTQLLTLKILQKLRVRQFVTAVVVFYIGISPALVNTALSLYSEILILTLIPGMILLLFNHLRPTEEYSVVQALLRGLALGLILALMTLVKGIFEVIAPLLLLFILLVYFMTQDRAPQAMPAKRKYFILMLTAFFIFQAGVFGYKSLNRHYNGNFTITNRGAWALYGYAARRAEPLTTERVLTALAYVMGEGACHSLFNEEKCHFWTIASSDSFGMGKLLEISRQGLSTEAVDKQMLTLAKEKILSRPWQYLFLCGVEGLKIFFWESTRLAFVLYPEWLERLYNAGVFKDPLRLGWALGSGAASGWAILILWRGRRDIFKNPQTVCVFLISVFIFFYTALYSLFLINTRYALPLAPLFLILIALMTDHFRSDKAR